MKTVMVSNVLIMVTYAICVTCAAIYFNDPGILWWYIFMGFLGFSYKSGGTEDGNL